MKGSCKQSGGQDSQHELTSATTEDKMDDTGTTGVLTLPNLDTELDIAAHRSHTLLIANIFYKTFV